jgi:2-methylcitrate dehydratase PrpD
MLAAILVKGRVTLAEFTDEAARDQSVLAVAGKVGYEVDASIDYPRQFIGHVAVRLHDGRVLEERQDHPRGGPDFPMTREEVEAKFRGNAALAVPSEQSARIIKIVGDLAAQADLTSLMESLTA